MTTEPTTPTIAFAGTVTRAEFERIQSLLLLPVWARGHVMHLVLAAIFLAVSLPGATAAAGVTDMLFATGFVIAMAMFKRRMRARTWQRVERLNGRIHGAVTPGGIEWNTAETASRFEWAKILKIRHGEDLTLAFYTPRCAFFFPRSFFESDEAWTAFNAEIDARVPRALSAGRRTPFPR